MLRDRTVFSLGRFFCLFAFVFDIYRFFFSICVDRLLTDHPDLEIISTLESNTLNVFRLKNLSDLCIICWSCGTNLLRHCVHVSCLLLASLLWSDSVINWEGSLPSVSQRIPNVRCVCYLRSAALGPQPTCHYLHSQCQRCLCRGNGSPSTLIRICRNEKDFNCITEKRWRI